MRAFDVKDEVYTDTLDALIVAMCRDYPRREEAVGRGTTSRRTEMEYKYLDYRIFDGAAEIVGAVDALTYINEIGSRIGYAYTAIDGISERTYKINKAAVKRSIARKLHLCD